MIPKSLLNKVKSIEIQTRKMVESTLSGNYQSAFKGKGINFSDTRDYQVGDDVRSINWKLSARSNSTVVNLFEEERELNVILMVDSSGSSGFGSSQRTKMDVVAEIAAVLGFSAVNHSDKVGLVLFSDQVEHFIPPKKGKQHMMRLIRDIVSFQPTKKGTHIGDALTFVMNTVTKRSVVFVISDFIDHHYQQALSVASRKHDVIPLVVEDDRELNLPDAGIMVLEDQETGELVYVNTSSASVRKAYTNMKYAARLEQERQFKQVGCDWIRFNTNQDYTLPLLQFFKRRVGR